VTLSEALDRAAAEGGRIVCLVFCGACGDKRPLAKVWDTSEGLFFRAEWSDRKMRDELRELEADLRRLAGRRVPFVARGVVRLLLDRPGPQDWPPRARCPRHGVAEVSVDDLRQAIRQARPRKAVVTIHRSPRTVC
jgi:hypothetical protein